VIAVSRCWFAALALAGRLLGRSESAVADAALTRLDDASALVVWVAAGYVARRVWAEQNRVESRR
jgi:arginine exporter protein ArgO